MATELITDPLVLSSGRIIRKAAHDLVGSDVDWPIIAAGVVLAQPVIGSAITKAAQHSLLKLKVLGLHEPREWGVEELDIHGKPIPRVKQCTECHKAYPCPTVEAVS